MMPWPCAMELSRWRPDLMGAKQQLESPRRKAVASLDERGSFVATSVIYPRRKAVASISTNRQSAMPRLVLSLR